jgi:hypothetical protein
MKQRSDKGLAGARDPFARMRKPDLPAAPRGRMTGLHAPARTKRMLHDLVGGKPGKVLDASPGTARRT